MLFYFFFCSQLTRREFSFWEDRIQNDVQQKFFRFHSSVYLHKRFKFVSMASTQNEWMLFFLFHFILNTIFVDDLVHLFKINSEKSIKYKFSKSLYAGAVRLVSGRNLRLVTKTINRKNKVETMSTFLVKHPSEKEIL